MKKIKVFFNGERLRDIYPFATKFQVFKWKLRKLIRKTIIGSVSLGIIYSAVLVGAEFYPKTVYTATEKEVVTVEVAVESKSAVMERIAKCESGNKHFSKNGQVLVVGNVNKTVDVGRYQINEYYWGAKATELGYDLFTEEGNEKMAQWLYAEKGTEPWIHSKACWNK